MPNQQEIMPITGMTCANCVATIERNVRKLPGIEVANVNLANERLTVAYDLALGSGAQLPGGDLRTLAGVVFVVAVTGLGAWITYLVVPQPGRPGVRSRWSAALGFFAALPIAYLALVILFQIVKPLLVR